MKKDICCIIVNRDRSDLTDSIYENIMTMETTHNVEICVVDMGSEIKSKYTTCHYEDPDYRGKCYGHNYGLKSLDKKYDYYWFMMNDLRYDDLKSLEKLVSTMENNPQIGLISPTDIEGKYPDSKSYKNSEFHYVTTCDYLSLMIRKECVEAFGFLNPEFKYCWGAIHEYSYKINKAGWRTAYSDLVQMKHFGGTTYGVVKKVISREEYRKRAKSFANEYFLNKYGENWDTEFIKYFPKEIRINTFKAHKIFWKR